MVKMTLKILAFSAFIWVILLAFLPKILSTDTATQYILKQLNRNANIEAKTIIFSWSGPQILENFVYLDSRKPFKLSSDRIEINNSLLDFLPGVWEYKGKAVGLNLDLDQNINPNLSLKNSNIDFEFTGNIYSGKIHELKVLDVSTENISKISQIPYLQELFGDKLNVGVIFPLDRKSNLYDFSFQGEDAELHGRVAANEKEIVATPQNPFRLKWVVTPQRSQALRELLFPDFNPKELVLSTPAKLDVLIDDMRIPFKKVSLNNLEIGKAKIDLGIMSFKKSGVLASIIKLISLSNSEDINLWLTPAYFSISNGTLNLQRIDILAMNLYPLSLWGKVDLQKEKLNMTVGIPLNVLSPLGKDKKGFSDQMLLFPLGGTFAKLDFDTSSAKKKIEQFAAKLFEGFPKSLLRGSKKKDEKDKNESETLIPPPTTIPLPWEK